MILSFVSPKVTPCQYWRSYLPEVEHLEGFAALDAEQPLAGDMDGPAAEVAANPASAELLGDGERSAGAAEEVSDEVARV